MRARFESHTEPGLLASAVVKPTPPVRQIDHPSPFGRRVHLSAIFVPLVRTGGHDDAWIYLERRVQVFEFRNEIPFQMLARLRSHIERRREEPPILQPIGEVRDVQGFQLEEELADAPAPGPRLKRDSRVRLPNPESRCEPELGLKSVADLLPVQR